MSDSRLLKLQQRAQRLLEKKNEPEPEVTNDQVVEAMRGYVLTLIEEVVDEQ